MKKRGGYTKGKFKDIDNLRKFDITNDIPLKKQEEMRDKGLRMISEGKVCVILNGSGLSEHMKLKKPKISHYPGWPLECSVIEYFLKKLRGIGQCAVKTYGKNFSGNREPIMVLLMVNEYEIDDIENFLVGEKYFGYTGIICLSQVKLRISFLKKFRGIFPLFLNLILICFSFT